MGSVNWLSQTQAHTPLLLHLLCVLPKCGQLYLLFPVCVGGFFWFGCVRVLLCLCFSLPERYLAPRLALIGRNFVHQRVALGFLPT